MTFTRTSFQQTNTQMQKHQPSEYDDEKVDGKRPNRKRGRWGRRGGATSRSVINYEMKRRVVCGKKGEIFKN